MNLNDFELFVSKRAEFGTKAANKIRYEQNVPANFYGYGELGELVSFSGVIDLLLLNKALASKTLFNKFTKVNYEGEYYIVVAQVIQRDSLTNDILHIDFKVVSNNRSIKMKIPFKFVDSEICEDIKLGGVLNVVMPFVELIAAPKDMPECIEFSLKNARSKVSLKLSDVVLPVNVRFSPKIKSITVATILASRKKNLETASESK